MKKALLFLSLFIVSCGVNKQSVLQNANRKGQPFDVAQDTLVKTRFKKNGKIRLEEYFLNDNRLFLRQYHYFKDGSWEVLQGKTFFKNDGYSYAYHPNGQLKMMGIFKDGKENGLRYTYYSNGNRQCVCNYLNNKRAGQSAIYWDNGQLFSKEEYREGLLWQVFERYQKDGQKMDIGTFKDGNGTIKDYNDKGSLEQIDTYINGVKVKTEKSKS